jgi:hypothetical protein
MITQAKLKEILHYDTDTGVFTWKLRPVINSYDVRRNTRYAGKTAGCLSHVSGYILIGINGKVYRAHRLAWLVTNGRWPYDQLDHKNQIRTDNRISNLREVSNQENMKNSSLRTDNTSGTVGVAVCKKPGKWTAYIYAEGRKINLISNASHKDAVEARKRAEVLHGFHINHGNATTQKYPYA